MAKYFSSLVCTVSTICTVLQMRPAAPVCFVMSLAPSIFDAMAESLGVSYAPVLGIAIAIAALIIKALLTDIEVSKMRVRQQRLVQKVALLESELEELTGRAPLDD